MVKQGDIIKINFSPQSGHEQAGSRPAVVISNNVFNQKAKLAIVCPISTNDKNFPLHVRLDARTKTTGVVLCDHVKSLDVNSREYTFIETIPKDILENVINKVFAEIELHC
ncbi:MAG: type II toxin-antitoxin system PemK/MazF family toxin [Defluviitaleaceae bacterium]|nr:type II toxin-antitoxin system PemK/MazF family toxin [Defluviitaleaceae bacterium]